jgi:sRNA-binding carbon storage regulator CsrA
MIHIPVIDIDIDSVKTGINGKRKTKFLVETCYARKVLARFSMVVIVGS